MKFITCLLALVIISNTLFGQAGALDTSFGDNGIMITTFENLSSGANSIAMQSNGKIILSGYNTEDANQDIFLARYLPNGLLDTEFGNEGKYIFSISDSKDACYDIETDDEDNIYLLGVSRNIDIPHRGYVMKLTKNGKIDSSFADDGIWVNDTEDIGDKFREIIILENGKIIISGYSIFQSITRSTTVQLNADGTIDNSFGTNGMTNISVPSGYFGQFASVDHEGNIISGGFQSNYTFNVVLVKLDSQGEPDLSFGDNGVLWDKSHSEDFVRSITIQSDNKIILGTTVTNVGTSTFGLIRYNEDGSFDESFGDNGRVYTSFMDSYLDDEIAHSVLLDEEENIIISGFVGLTDEINYAIACFDNDGNLDTSFGDNGKVITDLGFDDMIYTSILQEDGKLVCAGSSITSDDISSFSMARYETKLSTSTVELNKINAEINLSPNPSDGRFIISTDNIGSEITAVDLINLKGNVIHRLSQDETNFLRSNKYLEIDLGENITRGLYAIRLFTHRGIISQALIVGRGNY